jgi:hypothetical protein
MDMNFSTTLKSMDVYEHSSESGHVTLTPQTYCSPFFWTVSWYVLLGVIGAASVGNLGI